MGIYLNQNGEAKRFDGAAGPAGSIAFDNTGTDLESTDVEGAIKEVNEKTNDAIGDDVSIVISPTGVTMIAYNCIHISNKQLFVSFSFNATSEIADGTTFMHFEKNGSILALSNKRMDAACVRQNGETGFVGLLCKHPASNSFFINGRTFATGFYLCTCILDLQ